MPSVAEQLREAREAQNLTVYQVAETIKIRTDHVRALEEGNYGVFSAPVYIRGFVRSYATLLKLDVPKLMAVLQQELAQTGRDREPLGRPQRSRGIIDFVSYQLSKLNWRVALPILLLVLLAGGGIAIYRVWSQQKTKDPLEGMGEGIYRPAKSNSGPTLPLPAPRK